MVKQPTQYRSLEPPMTIANTNMTQEAFFLDYEEWRVNINRKFTISFLDITISFLDMKFQVKA